MNTLGSTPKTRIRLEESYALAISFECTAQVDRGVLVKYNDDDTVSPIAAATDRPFGVVTKGNRAADEDVTVFTPFIAVIECEAAGAVTNGAEVAAVAPVSGVQRFSAAGAGDVICGKALNTAAQAGDALRVGIYRGYEQMNA